jgi:hypothetical protein
MSIFNLPQAPNDASTPYKTFNEEIEKHPNWPVVMLNWNFYNLFKNTFKFDYLDQQNAPNAEILASIISDLQKGTLDKIDRKKLIDLLKSPSFVRGYEYADEHNAKAIFEFFKDLTHSLDMVSSVSLIHES